jgi:hypothetical protein
MTDCGICLESFNAKKRKKICCPYCFEKGGIYCKSCIERYLLEDSSTQARCPNTECRLGWSDDFLSDNMTKTYLLHDYKKHREKILLDMERARLPETQEDAGRYREAKLIIEPIQKRIAEIQAEVKQLPQTQAYLIAEQQFYGQNTFANQEERKRAYDKLILSTQLYRETVRPYNQKIQQLTTSTYTLNQRIVNEFGRVIVRVNQTNVPKSAWTFVMKCPGSCEGFVGIDWKCGLCKMNVCKDCREPMPHECDPNKVLTVKALHKEAKPCPKCASQISKIDGCDQMWCTQCQTAFSWRTGEIENDRVHNPHYFEWMRRNGTNIQTPTAVQQNTECLTPQEVLDHVIHFNSRHRELMTWCRIMRHFHAEVRRYQNQIREDGNEPKKHNLRVQRLVGEINDDVWKVALQRIEKAQQKNQRIVQILELYFQAGVDLLRSSLLETSDKNGICDQLVELRTYCSQQLEKIRRRFNNEVPNLEIIHTYM